MSISYFFNFVFKTKLNVEFGTYVLFQIYKKRHSIGVPKYIYYILNVKLYYHTKARAKIVFIFRG